MTVERLRATLFSSVRWALLPALLAVACQAREPANRTATNGARPNVVVIAVDDLRWDEFGAAGHPYLQTPAIDRLAAEGTWFTNAFHAVPLCSPNRASLLTGQYPSRHGIIDNVARNLASHRLRTFPHALQEQGYETAFIGKWHMGNDPTPRPGFDYWVGLPGQGRTLDPELFEDGRLRVVPGYVTDILTERALAFVTRRRERPFLLYLAHKAVHPDARQLDDGSIDRAHPSAYIPGPRHRGRYEHETLARRPNAGASAEDLAGKPALRRALAARDAPATARAFGGTLDPGTSEETIRRRAEMLLAVDEGLGRLLDTLSALGELDRTLIVFTSDNGYFFGEHGLSIERRLPYEESIRNVLLMRYPPLAPAGRRAPQLVSSIDVAPTVLDIAGAPIDEQIQGRSLVPLLTGDARGWREAVLVEFFTNEQPMPWLLDMDYRTVRTAHHKYIQWTQHPDEDELYDLDADPYELHNLAPDKGSAETRRRLRAELGRLVLQATNLAP
jgi:arylsulfatase A-like enzyme